MKQRNDSQLSGIVSVKTGAGAYLMLLSGEHWRTAYAQDSDLELRWTNA